MKTAIGAARIVGYVCYVCTVSQAVASQPFAQARHRAEPSEQRQRKSTLVLGAMALKAQLTVGGAEALSLRQELSRQLTLKLAVFEKKRHGLRKACRQLADSFAFDCVVNVVIVVNIVTMPLGSVMCQGVSCFSFALPFSFYVFTHNMLNLDPNIFFS